MRARLLLAIVLAWIPVAATAARFPANSPSTTNNDDSCDIAVLPAATLLLPYFEVDLDAPRENAATTLVTILNVSPSPQIAQMTLWTNLHYPVLSVPFFLTGYDVHTIDLYDLLREGTTGPANATSVPGSRSLPNGANPGFLPGAETACAAIPARLPASVAADARSALTTGRVSSGCPSSVADATALATGFATIDVVATCDVLSAADGEPYFRRMLFDNVLSGEYHAVAANRERGNFAGGNPLVHIRAVPEGGPPATTAVATNLPYTFYDRLTNLAPGGARTFDRRQPLPSQFAARSISAGRGSFETDLKIWREGVTPGGAACSAYLSNRQYFPGTDVIRFDEHENPTSLSYGVIVLLPPPVAITPVLKLDAGSSGLTLPFVSQAGDVGGWFYFNLDNGGAPSYSAARDLRNRSGARPSQGWIAIAMRAEGRFGIETHAAAMANGCTAPAAATGTTAPIAPGANVTP